MDIESHRRRVISPFGLPGFLLWLAWWLSIRPLSWAIVHHGGVEDAFANVQVQVSADRAIRWELIAIAMILW